MSDNTLTINDHLVEFHEMHEDGRINFKLDYTWRDPLDFIIPNVTAFEFILKIHHYCSGEKRGFWSREMPDFASNSEVKRWLENSAGRFNGKALKPKDLLDFPLYSVVLFPKANRITIL
jgi:hypothetical protein